MDIRLFKTNVRLGIGAVLLMIFFGFYGTLLLSGMWNIFIFATLSFICLLMHEFAHVFIARAVGAKCENISVSFIGMASHIEGLTRSAWKTFFVAVVGPISSFLMAGISFAIYVFLAPAGDFADILVALVVFNLIIAVFNITPLFPLDGGRVAHAVFWAITKDKLKGMKMAVYLGRALIVVLMGYLTYDALSAPDGQIFNLLFPAVIAYILWVAGSRELLVESIGFNVGDRVYIFSDPEKGRYCDEAKGTVESILYRQNVGFIAVVKFDIFEKPKEVDVKNLKHLE
ncbi:MAG: site-2 protease family protein [Candidatus Spechtbacterales bacterium]|nr:site-2 protease family protein [Candidatus Spechtbacterales bacterium]